MTDSKAPEISSVPNDFESKKLKTPRPLRLLIVNRGVFRVPPESSGGGAERHAYSLANHLARLGNDVHFVTKTRPGASYDPNVTLHKVPPERAVIPSNTSFFGWIMKHLFSSILSFFVAVKVLQKTKPTSLDAIHCHAALSATLLSICYGRLVPVVYTGHDGSPWVAHYEGSWIRVFRKIAYLLVEVPCLRLATRVVSVSPTIRQEVIRWGVSPNRTAFVPSGVDLPSHSNTLATSGIQYGLFVGQLVRRKGVHILLDAISKIASRNMRLVIVGEGPEKNRLKEQAVRLGLAQSVSFSGYVDDHDLDQLYKNASFFVLPSSAEGLPLALLEAAAQGIPLIVSKASASGFDLTDGRDCLLFSSLDADELGRCIQRVGSDDRLRKELSQAASMFAREQQSWETVAEKIVSIYQDAGKDHGSFPRTSTVGEAPLATIQREVATRIPARSVYLVGSRARRGGGFANDYDIIAVLSTPLIPLYLARLKRLGLRLTNLLNVHVEVNPLPTFRLYRARGSLFLMKAREEAQLLAGKDLLRDADTGDWRKVDVDWYFSMYSSLLKDLLVATNYPQGCTTLASLTRKISETLQWMAEHSRPDIATIAGQGAQHFRAILSSEEKHDWFVLRDAMSELFTQLASILFDITSSALVDQIDFMMRIRKRKAAIKNFEYGILLMLLKRRIATPRRLLSSTMIVDRYRAALLLLLTAVSRKGYESGLTRKARDTLRGCVGPLPQSDIPELWESLRGLLLEHWTIAQPVMGL